MSRHLLLCRKHLTCQLSKKYRGNRNSNNSMLCVLTISKLSSHYNISQSNICMKRKLMCQYKGVICNSHIHLYLSFFQKCYSIIPLAHKWHSDKNPHEGILTTPSFLQRGLWPPCHFFWGDFDHYVIFEPRGFWASPLLIKLYLFVI